MMRRPDFHRIRNRRDLGDPASPVVAITGGARGIGAAAAAELTRLGARVAIGDVDGAAASETAARLPNAVGLQLDVTNTRSYEWFCGQIAEQLGAVDVLIANAGIMWVGRYDEEPEHSVERQLAVNVGGVIRGFGVVAPIMASRGRGHIIVVASAASKLAPAGEATYAATKHAVYGYCTAVREELRSTGVHVSVLMPTVVATDLATGTSSGLLPLLTPDNIAQSIVSLVRSRKPELTVPRVAGLAAASLAVTPARFRGRAHRILVPNQVALLDQKEREAYQRTVLDG